LEAPLAATLVSLMPLLCCRQHVPVSPKTSLGSLLHLSNFQFFCQFPTANGSGKNGGSGSSSNSTSSSIAHRGPQEPAFLPKQVP